MGFITKEGLEELKRYKYVSGGYSFMDKIMNHWWEFFVKLIPLVRLNSHFTENYYFESLFWRIILTRICSQ